MKWDFRRLPPIHTENTDILGIKLIMRTIARVVCDEMGNGEVGECYMEIEMLQKI